MQTKGCALLVQHIEKYALTKKMFAEASGISSSMLSHILAGKRQPTLAVAFLIERASEGEVPAASWLERGTE